MRCIARLLAVAESQIRAEADHAGSRGDALAAAKAGAGSEFALEWSGEENDHEVGSGVEDHGDGTQDDELQEDVAALRSDELRDEGKEEERGLGIEGFGEDALTEGALRGHCGEGHLGVAGANHADAEPDEVCGSSIFYGVKGHGGSGENGGDAEGGGADVKESADEGAERRGNAFAAAAGESARQHVENAGAGGDGEKKSGGKKESETMEVKHAEILRHLWIF